MGISSYILLLCSAVCMADARSLKGCVNDDDCVGKDFCYSKTRLCSPCIQCSAYLRHDVDDSCVKEPWQCGDCLKGYEDEILLDGQLRGLCVSSSKPATAAATTASQPREPESQKYLLLAGAAACMLAVVTTVSIFMKVRVNVQTRVEHSCDDSLSTSSSIHAPSAPPPPYEECKDLDEGMIDGYVCGREEQKCQMASKFLDPNYVKTPNNTADNHVNNNPPQDEVDGLPSPEDQPFLIEENTLPSNWSPGPDYEEPPVSGAAGTSTAPLITSFAGILRLNSAGLGGQTPNPNSQDNPPEPANHSASENPQGAPQLNITNITVINTSAGPTGIFNVTNI